MKLSFAPARTLLLFLSVICFSGCIKTIPGISNNPPPGGNDSATPTPVGTPLGGLVTKSIGAGGGSITSEDGKAELVFPAGALGSNTDISIQAITNNAPNGVGNAYRFLPEGIKFLQQVTLKFHYTADDLAVTLADLMGIAFQDSVGIWYRVNNFTNDSAKKVISAPIMHFSDWSGFDIMRISPVNTNVRVSKSVNLSVEFVDAGNDEDLLAPVFKKTAIIKWSANGILNGNSTVGTVTGSGNDATFKAPAKVPSGNPVAVSAELPFKTTYHSKSFDNLLLISNITIIDGEKYLLEVRITETAPPLVYTDSVNMIVVVNSDGTVIVSDFNNFAPKSDPASATVSSCTATWIPDGIGEVNVTAVSGTISGSSGDPSRDLFLTFTNTGAVSPTYKQQCEGADPVTNGGIPFSGLPTVAFFTLVPGQTVYVQDTGGEFDKLSLIE
jgi:hypothetical protein